MRADARSLGASILLAAAGLAGLAAPARAGVHFRAVSRMAEPASSAARREVEVEGWVAGTESEKSRP